MTDIFADSGRTGKWLMTPVEPDYDPANDYPPKGTPETALVIVINEELFEVLDHTGRYFHGMINCAGYSGVDILIDAVPDEPGYWVFENGVSWKDHYEGDYGISGDWRKARLSDFTKYSVECPIEIDSDTDRYPVEVFWENEDQGFIALAPDLPGCSAFGESRQKALLALQSAIEAWIAAQIAAGNPIPNPSQRDVPSK